MKEFRGTRLPASVIDAALDQHEVIVLHVGRIRAVRVLMLPALEWSDAVRAEYASNGHALKMSRETLSAAGITEIVQHQVDGKWNPYTYGELVDGDRVRAYLVPANRYWTAKVESQ